MTSMLNIGPEARVNGTTSGIQRDPKIATLQDGSYVIVWYGNGTGDDSGVFYQHYDSQGHKIGVETLVNTSYITSAQNSPDIAALDDGGFVVVWEGAGAVDSYGIYYQTFNSTGAPVVSGLVNTNTASSQSQPSVTSLVGGGFAVSWSSLNQVGGTSANDIYSQIFDATGAKSGSETLVNTTTVDEQSRPDTTRLADGSFVVTWSSYAQDGTQYNVFARHYSATGTALSPEFLVNTTTYSYQISPQVIALADGGYLIDWSGYAGNASTAGVGLQRYDSSDHKVGAEQVIASPYYYTVAPGMAALSDGGYVVAWSDYSVATGSSEIAFQRFDDAGNAMGPYIRVNTYTNNDQVLPQVAALDNGGFVVTWRSTGEDGSDYGVYQKAFTNTASDSGNQLLFGTSSGDDLDGGSGADTMYGGVGDDTYHVNSVGDVVSEQPNQGTDTVMSSVTYALSADVENLVLTGLSAIDGSGNSGDNIIFGNAAGNTLNGNGGYDEIHGGGGKDVITAGDGNDILYGDDGNDGINGGGGFDQIYGGSGEDILSGDAGDDWIDGGTGNDSISGGSGNDQLFGGDGNDEIYGFYDNDILFGGAGDDRLDGGNGDDVLNGDDGNDILVISAGTDTIHGGAGEDRLEANLWSQGVNVNLTTGRITNMGGAPGMKAYIDGVEDVTGSASNDVIVGDAGNNILDGGGGADIMKGGDGNDIYYVDNTGDTITESSAATGGYDEVVSTVSYTLSAYIEELTLTGGAIIGNGNASDNILTGNSLANQIDGKAGNDTMTGGLGDDTYWVDSTGDVVVENVGEGTDTVRAAISYTLGANLENLVLTGTANINATGNSVANVLTGNSGDNVLDGGAGADTMAGGAGNDTYYVDNAGDIVQEASGQGTDVVNSSITFSLAGQQIENLILTGLSNINATGNGLANILTGNAGNNTLDGGYGADTLWGLSGADVFLFNTSSGADTVADFSAAQDDTINIHAYTHGTANLGLITQVGADIQINLGGTNIITILNTTNDASFQSHIVW